MIVDTSFFSDQKTAGTMNMVATLHLTRKVCQEQIPDCATFVLSFLWFAVIRSTAHLLVAFPSTRDD